jgi:hypothetical protein
MNFVLSYFFALMLALPATNAPRTVSGITGFQFSSKIAKASLFTDIPKTKFSKLHEYASVQTCSQFFSPPRWALTFCLPCKTDFSFEASAGMLCYSGSVSRLKNPPPSTTVSPLRQSFDFSPGLHAVRQSSSSTDQPLSASVSLAADLPASSCSAKKASAQHSSITAECAFFEDKTVFASASFFYYFSRLINFKTAFTGGRFYLENDSSTLWKAGGGFEPGWFYACVIENAFSSPQFKCHFSAGVHQTPWSTAAVWLCVQTRNAAGPFLLDTSFFFVPTAENTPDAATLIGTDSSPCRTIAQMSVNPQLAAGPVRLGCCGFVSYKATATKTPVRLAAAKLAAGASFEYEIFFCRTEASAVNLLVRGTPPSASATPEKSYEISFDSRVSSDSVRFSSSFSAQHIPPATSSSKQKQIYTAAISASPGKSRIFAADAGCSVSVRDGKRNSSSADCGISIRPSSKHIRSSFKCSIRTVF